MLILNKLKIKSILEKTFPPAKYFKKNLYKNISKKVAKEIL